MKKTREFLNLELFRCLLMLTVLVVHYNNDTMGGALAGVERYSSGWYLVYLIESLAIIGVNGFIVLTGYFSSRKKTYSLRKSLGLLLLVVGYNLLFYFVGVAIGTKTLGLKAIAMCFIPRNWYIILYIVLTVLIPYLNILVERLSIKQSKILMNVLILLFSIWPTMQDCIEGVVGVSMSGTSTISNTGASAGYSIVNFVVLYLIGAFIREGDLLSHDKKIDILVYFLASLVTFGLSLKIGGKAWFYSSVFVILAAVALFNFFRKIKFNQKWINYIAPMTLSVYLIHTQDVMIINFWNLFNIKEAASNGVCELIVNMCISVIAMYVICIVVAKIFIMITKPISKLLDKFPILNKKLIELE